jgi:hypothetical protein
MTSRRLNIILPIVTLVVSFIGVFTLGQIFAVGRGEPIPSQTSPSDRPTNETTSAQITVRDFSIEILLHDLSAEDPAPGILRTHPPAGVSGRLICVTEAVSESWSLIGENGLPDNRPGAVCRSATANQPNGELMIMLVKR